MTDIRAIPALRDNYIWIIRRDNLIVVVDPSESQPVLNFIDQNNLNLVAILITHHHFDHVGGISDIIKHIKVPVYGPKNENIPEKTHSLSGGDVMTIAPIDLTYQIIDCPGHTLGHIAYFGQQHLFCGDTLFSGGCGRVFEGTHRQMFDTLTTLSQLPQDTVVYPAHEYTLSNLAFAQTIEPDNQSTQRAIETAKQHRSNNNPTLPTTIRHEKMINPFLRCNQKNIQASLKTHDDLSTFSVLRDRRDCW